MPGPIIRPDLVKLTPDSRSYLIANCNDQPDEVIMHYLQTKEITLDELPGLPATRRDTIGKEYEKWLKLPDPREVAAWEKISPLLNDPFVDVNQLEPLLEQFINDFPASVDYKAIAEKKLHGIAVNRWEAAKGAYEGSVAEMEDKLRQMEALLAKYSQRLSDEEKAAWKRDIDDLQRRIAREKLKPLIEEWERIAAMPETYLPDMERKEQAMVEFINKYGSRFPVAMLQGFNDQLSELRSRMAEAELEDIRYDFDALVDFIRKQKPGTELFRKADEYLWALVTEELDADLLKKFIKKVPNSSYINEARRLQAALNEWLDVKNRGDIFDVQRYINDHLDAPQAILDDAENFRNTLKKAEIAKMEDNPSAYDRRRLFGLINIKIVSVDELVKRGLTTYEAFSKAQNRDTFVKSNPIAVTYTDSELLNQEDITDVYLFGVPSTGKTCVLMGLLGSNLYDWNNAIAAGEYGDILSAYRDNHILPGRTLNEQFFCIHGKATDSNGKKHLINVIELAGEQFLDKIAMNPDKELSLTDMDAIAAESFRNKNRKIFFIVIDPTVNVIEHAKEVKRIDDEGNEIVDTVTYEVAQKTVIQKIANILSDPANAEIMKQVDALHFIATKWDVMEHANRDVQECKATYSLSMRKVYELCQPKAAHINEATGFKPKLYTFSLGKFHVGGTFDYDHSDSDKLMNVITENTLAIRDYSFLEKMVDKVLNQKVF